MKTESDEPPTFPSTSTQGILGALELGEGTQPAAVEENVETEEAPAAVKSKRGRKRKVQSGETTSPVVEPTASTQKRSRFQNGTEQKCSECNFVTKSRLLLKKHCILEHADKIDPVFLLNQFKCDFCDKIFKVFVLYYRAVYTSLQI